jgi:hypothetical protein
MNGAVRRSNLSRQPFVPALPEVVAERDGLKMRATAPSGNDERPIASRVRRLSFAGEASGTNVFARCFVPDFDGAFLSSDSKDALWDRFWERHNDRGGPSSDTT